MRYVDHVSTGGGAAFLNQKWACTQTAHKVELFAETRARVMQ